jgi:hypothetical protein
LIEEDAVPYVQFKRLRRGVPEVIRELYVPSVDGDAALAAAQRLIGTRHWPVRTDALRVMDDGGRTLLDWIVPAASQQPSTYSRRPAEPVTASYEPQYAIRSPDQSYDRIVHQHELREDLGSRMGAI